jgi:hypothetical protein
MYELQNKELLSCFCGATGLQSSGLAKPLGYTGRGVLNIDGVSKTILLLRSGDCSSLHFRFLSILVIGGRSMDSTWNPLTSQFVC